MMKHFNLEEYFSSSKNISNETGDTDMVFSLEITAHKLYHVW